MAQVAAAVENYHDNGVPVGGPNAGTDVPYFL